MKLSIITTCLNSEKTIRFTLNSVLSQSYKNIEHIIVDGGSTDGTKKLLKKYYHPKKKVFNKKGYSIYEAINFGIKKSTGEIVSILNADDLYNNNTIIEEVMQIIKSKNYDIYLGDVVFVKNNNLNRPVRFYSSSGYKKNMILKSLMPPHPGSFVKRNVYNKYCLYNEDLTVASDYNFFLETLIKFKLKFITINKIITRMRTGGVSTKNFFSFIFNGYEIYKSFKINNIKPPIFQICKRIPAKLGQFLYLNIKKLNKEFVLPKNLFEQNYFYSKEYKLVLDINKIINKNFILSGMNLAFLGSLVQKKVSLYKDLYFWPDGIFADYNFGVKKIPGRKLIKKIKLPKIIKKIVVMGNLSPKSHDYLDQKFKLPIYNIKLPYGDINQILNSVTIDIPKKSLVFITLPTPKQEIIAEYLQKKNKYYKIICIGASIGMLSGEEKVVPKILYNYEFLWRLRFDTRRRVIRLVSTFYHYLVGKYITKKFEQNYIRLIK